MPILLRGLADAMHCRHLYDAVHHGDPGGTKMPNLFTTATTEHDAQVEKRLWQAVIVSTIQEWISGPLRYKRIAEEYLFQDRSDFPLVCQSAGLDVDRLRQQLTRLRAHSNPISQAMRDFLPQS
jgi:hypothetical protein